ncbi:MAG: hypothetical protein R3F42_11445 [Pseudomonadota bacterium]
MEENEYKETYHALNVQRCVFEKAINSRRAQCSKSVRFHLADREGISCNHASGNSLCTLLLELMRANARFALHLASTHAPLPHAKEIRVQTGGMLGLQGLVEPAKSGQSQIDDIIGTIAAALHRYGSLEALPYDVIVKDIVRFEGRRKRSRKPDADA